MLRKKGLKSIISLILAFAMLFVICTPGSNMKVRAAGGLYYVYITGNSAPFATKTLLADAVAACYSNVSCTIVVAMDDDDMGDAVQVWSDKKITIKSQSATDIKTIRQPNAARHFAVHGNSLTLENIILEGAGVTSGVNGGLYLCCGDATMKGGAVIQHCSGSGVDNSANTWTALHMWGNATIRENRGDYGGGVNCKGILNMNDEASIINNYAEFDGGGVYAESLSLITAASGATFSGNIAGNGAYIMTDAGDILTHDAKIATSSISLDTLPNPPAGHAWQYAYNNG